MEGSQLKKLAYAFLDEVYRGALATINDDGSPCVIPLHLFHDDGVVYWFSSPETRHSQNIERDPRVSATLWTTPEGETPKALYVQTRASHLGDAARSYAVQVAEERLGTLPDVFKEADAYSLALGTLDEARSSENRWYFYT